MGLIDPWRERAGGAAQPTPDPDDHCSQAGAVRLAERLTKYWADRGDPREFEIYYVTGGHDLATVWGVRAKTAPVLEPLSAELERIRERFRTFVTAYLETHHPFVAYDAVVGRGKRGCRNESRARWDCIAAARDAFGFSTLQLARFFQMDHTSIMYAIDLEYREKSKGQVKKFCANRRAASKIWGAG